MFDRLEAGSLPTSLRMIGGEVKLEASAEGAAADAPKRFTSLAYTGGPMRLQGFYNPVVVDLEGLKINSQVAPVFREHDYGRPIGHSDKIEKTAKQIKVSGDLSHPGDDTDKVVAAAAKGYPWQVSIGTSIERIENVNAGQTVKVNGRNVPGPVHVIRAGTWRELSFVTLGADNQTTATIAASLHEGDPMTFSEWLKKNNIVEADTPEATMTTLRAAYKAEQSTPAPTPTPTKLGAHDTVEGVAAAERIDIARKQGIADAVKAAARKCPDSIDDFEKIGVMAVKEGWDVDRTEQRLIVASVAQAAPLVFSKTKSDINTQVVEAALAKSVGLQCREKVFSEQALEASDRHFNHSLGIHELIGICAAAGGFRDRVRAGNIAEALKIAFQCDPGQLRASSGPSTYSITGILSNTLRKTVRENFMFVEQVWRRIFSIASVKDFKQTTSYTLTGDLTYKFVAPGGEIRQGKLGETSYTNQADTYGLAMCLDRTSLINDDAGTLKTMGKRLGRGGGLKLNDVIWAVFNADTAFFTSGNGNYDTGTDTTFSNDGLVAAEILWSAMTDPDGKIMGHEPKFALVPPALKIAAVRMFGSMNFTANDEEGEMNPWAGKYEPVSSKYLTASTKAWYLITDPNDLPTLEVCFLDGREEPFVETVDMAPGRLGVFVQAYHDFGANFQEPRGAYKFKGEN